MMETVTEQVETTVEGTTSESVSQDDYINDAFTDYFFNEEKAEPPKDDDKKQDTQAQEPKDDPNKEKNPKSDDEANKEPEKKVDPFVSAFSTESGDFDLEKLLGVSTEGLNFQSEEKEAKQTTPEKTTPKTWKERFQAEKVFKDNIYRTRLGPLEDVYNAFEGAEMPDEVKQYVLGVLREKYAGVQQETDSFLKEREEEQRFQREEEERTRFREEARLEKLPAMAKANAGAIINSLPGEDSKTKINLYNRIMFGPNAGGEILSDAIELRYPDFESMPKEKQDSLKLNFVKELQADGNRLQRHFQRAYRQLIADPENIKQLMSQVSKNTEANLKSNQFAAQNEPTGSVNRQPQTGNSEWDSYFAPPAGAKTRI
jgi:hypothetical protein